MLVQSYTFKQFVYICTYSIHLVSVSTFTGSKSVCVRVSSTRVLHHFRTRKRGAYKKVRGQVSPGQCDIAG